MSGPIELAKRLASSVLGSGPARRLRVGFVGCGEHATANLYPCLPLLPVELLAVCARRKDRALRAARAFGAAAAHDDYVAMFEREPLEAVFVSVGASEHFRICAAALERGLHVFVEKPATASLEQTRRLQEIADRASRQVMVGFQKRHAPAYRKARELVADPGFGPLAAIEARFCVGPFRDEAAFLQEVAIHHLDLVRFFAGDVERLHAVRHAGPGPGLTSFAIAARFRGGAVGSFLFSTEQSWHARNERIALSGGGQSVVVENMTSLRHYRRAEPGTWGGPFAGPGHTFWEPNFTVPAPQNQSLQLNGFAPELAHFVDCVLAGRAPEPGLAEFAAALELGEAIRSQAEGAPA